MKFIWIIGGILFFFLFISSLQAATEEEKEAAKKLNEEILFEKEQEKREKESQLPPETLDSSVDQLKELFKTAPNKSNSTNPLNYQKEEKCFQIFAIYLNGNNIFNKKRFKPIYAKYLLRCIFKKDVDALITNLNSFYHDRGYSLTRVFINEKSNFVIGELFLDIVEGQIQKITIKNKDSEKKRKNKLRQKTAFPFLEGKVFSIYDIEQGLEQINRLRFSQARMKIIPAKEIGFSDIDITLDKAKYTYFSLGASSRGGVGVGDVYGEHNYNFNFSLEDTLGLNESFSLSYTRAEKDSSDDNLFNRSYSANISFPIGYYTISSAYSGSAYSQPQITVVQKFISKGNSDNFSLTLEKIILKKKGKKISLKPVVGTQENRVFVDDTLVDVSSRKLATATFNLIGSFSFKAGTIQSTIAYREGVPWFEAKEDATDIREEEPHAQYSLWFNNSSYSISFLKSFPINYTTRIYAQTTDKEVYTAIGIGGSGSVRGYSSNNYSDDIGWYQQHTLSTYPFQKASFLGSLAKALKFSLFYDYGCVESSAGNKNYRCLAGGGTSLSFSSKWVNLSYSYEVPNYSTTTFITEEPIVKRMSASIKWDFGF